LIFEDEHLLVVNKPAGLNTHAPDPLAGEGLYDWLRHREPRWAGLTIMHRLDKAASGLLVFAKSGLANRSLTAQFTRRAVRKEYLLLSDRPMRPQEFTVASAIVRAGQKYVSRPAHAGGARAETRFRVVGLSSGLTRVEAEPLTGRTHQIRVQAAAQGFPILGDQLYGGTPADRVYLHAARLVLRHPATGAELSFEAPADFSANPGLALRLAVVDSAATNAYRLIHGASDGWAGWYVDRLGDFLLSQSEQRLSDAQLRTLAALSKQLSLRGAYHKPLLRDLRNAGPEQASPQKVLGAAAPDEFIVCENGLQFALSFREGYSVGLFLDQRDNRRRFLVNHIAANFPLGEQIAAPHPPTPENGTQDEPFSSRESSQGWNSKPPTRPLEGLEMLNTFAYTCGFSVCAARAGARTTSLDLSKKYLEWGRRNFRLNGLDPAQHDFFSGDAFNWMVRLGRKQRQFHIIVLDPPTFSQSKEQGVFQAQKDYAKLVAAALPLLRANGVLFASTNAGKLTAEEFLEQVTAPIRAAQRGIARQQYVPQPIDFPVSRGEPAYLKTVWLRIR
jgi:23S rRNA (cytosine1962-C5)-methyltransferase